MAFICALIVSALLHLFDRLNLWNLFYSNPRIPTLRVIVNFLYIIRNRNSFIWDEYSSIYYVIPVITVLKQKCTTNTGISPLNNSRKCNEILWNTFDSVLFCAIQRLMTHGDHILHGSTFVLFSLCSCRKVTGTGTEPQSSVSHTGTADAADRPALPWPDLPWHMTPLTPAGSGDTHITKMISFICAIPYLLRSTSGFLYIVFNDCNLFCATITLTYQHSALKETNE